MLYNRFAYNKSVRGRMYMDLFEKIVTPIISKKYSSFYNVLANLSKSSYRYEAKNNLLKKTDTLTKEQRSELKKYWNKYTKDFDLSFHQYYINRTGNFDVRYIPDDLYAGYIDRYSFPLEPSSLPSIIFRLAFPLGHHRVPGRDPCVI